MKKPLYDRHYTVFSPMLSKSDTRYKGRHSLIISDFTMVTIVSYGEYTFVIKATATQGTETYEAEAQESVKVVPPLPKITEIKFVNSIDMLDDEGKKIDPIYYQDKSGVITQNPIAVAWSEIGATTATILTKMSSKDVSGDSGKKTHMNMTFELESPPPEPVTYTFRAVSSTEGEIILKDYQVAFEKGSKKTQKDISISAEEKVLKVKDLRWQAKYKENIQDWNEILTTEQPIYIALKIPEIKDKGLYEKLYSIGTTYASNAQTPTEVQNRLVEGIFNYLTTSGYKYNPSIWHVDYKGWHGNSAIFHFSAMLNTPIRERQADCEDASALYQTCCNILGVPMSMRRIVPIGLATFTTNPLSVFGSPNSIGTKEFNFHQVGYYKDPISSIFQYVYDPTCRFQSGFAIHLFPDQYMPILVHPQFKDLVKYEDDVLTVDKVD